jgi:hypothetical protein
MLREKTLQLAGRNYNDSELFPPEPIASVLPRLPNLQRLKKLANIHLGDDAVLEALSTAPHFQRLELYMDLSTSHLRICRLQGLLNLTLKVDTHEMGHVKGADLQARVSALPGISHANLRKLTLKTRLGPPPKRGFFVFLSKCSFPALESLALDFKASQMAEPESLQLLTSFFGAHRRLTELSFVNVRTHQLAYALPPEACHSVEVVFIGYLVEKVEGDRTFRLHPDSSVRKLVLLHGLHEQHRREYSSFLGGICSHLPAVLDSAGHSHPRQVVFSELEWQGVYCDCDCDCGWCPPKGIFETCLKLGRELSAKGIALVDKHGRLVVQVRNHYLFCCPGLTCSRYRHRKTYLLLNHRGRRFELLEMKPRLPRLDLIRVISDGH